MNDQTPQSTESRLNSKKLWAHTVGIIVIAVLFIGNVMYVWKNVKLSSTVNLLGDHAAALQNQLEQLQPAISEVTSDEGNASEATWKLVSGDPNETCFKPTWAGEAVVHGWYVLGKNYAGQDAWNLKIIKKDFWKIPGSVAGDEIDYHLIGSSPGLETQLKNASESNPLTLNIKGFSVYCEGNPFIYLNGLVTASTLNQKAKVVEGGYQLPTNITEDSAKNTAIEFAKKSNFQFPSAHLRNLSDNQWVIQINCSDVLAAKENASCPTDVYMEIKIDKNTGNIIDWKVDSAA